MVSLTSTRRASASASRSSSGSIRTAKWRRHGIARTSWTHSIATWRRRWVRTFATRTRRRPHRCVRRSISAISSSPRPARPTASHRRATRWADRRRSRSSTRSARGSTHKRNAPRPWPRRMMPSPISSERPAHRYTRVPAEGPMHGKPMTWGVAAAVTALTMTLGGCTSKGAEADEARPGAESAAAAAPGGDTSAARALTVPSAQLERLHVEPVAQTSFRPTIQVTGTAQFNADVSTQVIPPISGPVMRILTDVGAEVHRGQALALVSSPDFATTIADFRKAQAAYVQAKRVADQDEQLWKNDAIAKRDLEQAQTDAAAASADRDAALQQLRALGVDEASIAALRDGKDIPQLEGAIRAPLDGTVVERL